MEITTIYQLNINIYPKDGVWIAHCPAIEVMTHDETEERAKDAIEEAITLWIESCLERNTLNKALNDLNFEETKENEFNNGNNIIQVIPNPLTNGISPPQYPVLQQLHIPEAIPAQKYIRGIAPTPCVIGGMASQQNAHV